MDQSERTFGALKQAVAPKLALTCAQLVWALVLVILGRRFVDSSSAGVVIFGSLLLGGAAGVALHAILWLRSRVVVSPARVEIVSAFRRRTIPSDQLDRFQLGTTIQGRPAAVLLLRSGGRITLHATTNWWGQRHRQAVETTVAEMNAAAGIGKPETLSSRTRL